MHGGEAERRPRCHVDVVEADDGEIVGHASTQLGRLAERADGDVVVGAQHRRRWSGGVDEVAHADAAALVVELAAHDLRRRPRDTGELERPPEAGLAVAGRAGVGRPQDHADMAMAATEHQRAGGLGAGEVVGAHARRVGERTEAVEEHERQVAPGQLVGQRVADPGGHQDRPVDRAIEQTVDHRHVVALGEQRHAVAAPGELVVDRGHQLVVERVVQLDDERDAPAWSSSTGHDRARSARSRASPRPGAPVPSSPRSRGRRCAGRATRSPATRRPSGPRRGS